MESKFKNSSNTADAVMLGNSSIFANNQENSFSDKKANSLNIVLLEWMKLSDEEVIPRSRRYLYHMDVFAFFTSSSHYSRFTLKPRIIPNFSTAI